MKNQPEFRLQLAVTAYLRLQYPTVLFMSDTIAQVYLTRPQKIRNASIQKRGFHCPDIIIFEPRGRYHGLFIELKVNSPFKLNGELLKDEHLANQQKTIHELNALGYFASFATGFEQAVLIIDNYLKRPKTLPIL